MIEQIKFVEIIISLIPNVIVPTFDTKVTEYLCWGGGGGGGFLQTNFDFFELAIFDRIFKYHSKGIVVLSLNLKRYFTCDHFS